MQQQLDNGLILRSLSEGCASDRDGISRFYSETFSEAGDDDPIGLLEWSNTLASGRHPTVTHDDIWVVVDSTQNDKIVSALLLIPQTWQYDGIDIGVGRIELVATDKNYRRRGLIRALMTAAHERSEALGHQMQAITGIGHYYRRFGYAMAVELGIRDTLPFYAINALPDDQQPKYTFRPATETDAEQLSAWDNYRARSSRLSHVPPPEVWRFNLTQRHEYEPFKTYVYIIINQQGEEVGYFSLRASKEALFFGCQSYVVGEKSSYLDTFDDVTRFMKQFATDFYAELPKFLPSSILFDSGMPETIDTILQATPGGRVVPETYAWYVRVPDVGAFIKHIAPVLEARLSGSGANCYTGKLSIGYCDLTGVEITFQDGKIIEATQQAFDIYEGDVRFPYHSFLNVMFGHRTQQELNKIYPESYANRTARVLLDAMFPRQRSWLIGLA